MNILHIVSKARKQSRVKTGNVCDLLEKFENIFLLKVFLHPVNAQDCFCHKFASCFSENVSQFKLASPSDPTCLNHSPSSHDL